MASERRCPDIFAYEHVRPFLQDWKKLDAKRSFAFLGLPVRLNAPPSQVYAMFTPDRRKANPISPTYTEAFVRLLQLDDEEERYFRLLVRAEEAKAEEDRVWAVAEAGRLRRARASQRMPTSHIRLLEWYYFAILALAMGPGVANNPASIARLLRPELSPEEVARAINHLLDAGLVVEDGEGGLRARADLYRIDPGQEPALYAQRMADWHRWFVERASGALAEFPSDERDFRATVVNVPADRYAAVVQELRDCQGRIEHLCHGGEEGERVYVVNTQLFPLTLPRPPARGG